ncbi:MAG: hypothetical protein R3C42_06260 [Parvularculaceae bacterium]|nr:hypothetical protein [Parvularculaceae bacterium]
MVRIAFGALVALGLMAGPALAGKEKTCSSQYALEDQLLLEWAALGGDPHAQMAIAQCAFPASAKAAKMTPDEISYAVRWTTFALCEAEISPSHDQRDLRLRALKEDANISFRRFGGLRKNEKLNWREREFIEYRQEQNALLAERRARLVDEASEVDVALARNDLADDLSRMGPAGLLKLAELSSCPAFGASKEFEAAAWSAASESWRSAQRAGVYGQAQSREYDLPTIALEKTNALSAPERRLAAREKQRLMRSDPKRIEALETRLSDLEDKAALRRLADFSIPVAHASADAAPFGDDGAVTTALQFALETLGYVDFVSGPDNDYGPTTRAAVARMKTSRNEPATTTLSDLETRQTICRAALADDPVSLYHVALMYKTGAGFPQSDVKAAAALARSQTTMIAKLGGDALPDWKRAAYNEYAPRIRAAAEKFNRPDVGAATPVCD